MASRWTLVATLVVVVLLAGCSGFLGGDAAGSPEEFDHADGFSADGVTDGEQAVQTYDAAIREKGNYTGTYQYNITADGNQSVARLDYRIDFDSERGYQQFYAESDGSEGSREFFYEGDQRYYRTTVDGEQYRGGVEEQEFPAEDLTAAEAIRPLLTNASNYETSVDERDGTSVVVYESGDIGNASELYAVENPDDVTGFSAQFAVDADGVVHTAEYELSYTSDGVERSLVLTFELSNLGETSVERPDWTDDV